MKTERRLKYPTRTVTIRDNQLRCACWRGDWNHIFIEITPKKTCTRCSGWYPDMEKY